jgi:hypothetical protein
MAAGGKRFAVLPLDDKRLFFRCLCCSECANGKMAAATAKCR